MSNLLFNIHIWGSFCGQPRRIINVMYNRVWRRVDGNPRFARTSVSDEDVRSRLGVPSIDCCIRRKRLIYLTRLSPADLPPLLALLQTHSDLEERLPWANLVLADIAVLRRALPTVFVSLPTPDVDMAPYWYIFNAYPSMWREIVMRYHTSADDVVLSLERNSAGLAH